MVVFKQISDIKKDGGRYTQKDHVWYVDYIATRDGAVYGEGMEHGLFGRLHDMDKVQDIPELSTAARYVGEKFAAGTNIYRSVISLTEAEAAQLGYMEREKWVGLLERNMFDIADEYNIKFSSLEFVASVHFEPNHPHVQFNFWDKNQTIQQKVIPPKQFERRSERIRASLSKDIYADILPSLLQAKETSEKHVSESFQGFLSSVSGEDMEAGKNVLKAISAELCDEKMLNIKELSDDYVCELANAIADVRESIKRYYPSGALKYKYLPQECKAAVDSLTAIVLRHPDFRSTFHHYLKSVRAYSEALANGEGRVLEEQKRAARKMRMQLGNKILGYLKSHPEQQAVFAEIVCGNPESAINVFDCRLLELGGDSGVFHDEDISDARMRARIESLVKSGDIHQYGPRFELTAQLRARIAEEVESFKQNKIYGMDKDMIELGHFTLDELRSHPKNEKQRMEKRLPLLLMLKLITEQNGAYQVTAEYRERYREQLERYRQSHFEQWLKNQVDAEVKISLWDHRFITLAQDGSFTQADLERSPNFKRDSFRLRFLVAERYLEKGGDTYRLTPHFCKEVGGAVAEFQKHLYKLDEQLIEMGRFTMDDLKQHPDNKRRSPTDTLGAMERRLPQLMAIGFVQQKDEIYETTEAYKAAYYRNKAEYRKKNYEKQTRGEKQTSRVSLFDSEFQMMAHENSFTLEDVERHPEAGKLDWQLRRHMQSGLIQIEGDRCILTERFCKRLAFVQKQFLRGFSVEYRDRAFLKLADGGTFSKDALKEHPDGAYLKWRVYGLQFKGLIAFDGKEYHITPELEQAVEKARKKFLESFSPRIFDKLFLQGDGVSAKFLQEHPLKRILEERLEGLLHHKLLEDAGDGAYRISPELTAAVKECSDDFEFVPSDMALVTISEVQGEKNHLISQAKLHKNFRAAQLEQRLTELVLMGHAKQQPDGYILPKETVSAILATLPEFKLHLFDSEFLKFTIPFTREDVENHPMGLLLADRMKGLLKNEFLTELPGETKSEYDIQYAVNPDLAKKTAELYEKTEGGVFDMNLLRMAKDGVIKSEQIAALEKPVQTEFRLYDLICRGYATFADGRYTLTPEFSAEVRAQYQAFRESFLQPCDLFFTRFVGSTEGFPAAAVRKDEFYAARLKTLEFLRYVKVESGKVSISQEMCAALDVAKTNFTVSYMDAQFVYAANKQGVVNIGQVLAIDSGYYEKRMHSLLELGLLNRSGEQTVISQALRLAAIKSEREFAERFQVSCYDGELQSIGKDGKFTLQELEKHPDAAYFKTRLRTLMAAKLVQKEGDTYLLTNALAAGAKKAMLLFQAKGTDNRFLQINGTASFSEQEANEHYELNTRLRELCKMNLIVQDGKRYTVTATLKDSIQKELDDFVENKVGLWDKPLLELSQTKNGFTLSQLKAAFPADAEKYIRRLEYLHIYNLFRKEGDRYVHTEQLERGIAQAEKRQHNLQRQVAMSLLLDAYKLVSRIADQENHRAMTAPRSRDLSREAKRDMAAERSSANGGWDEYER